MERNPEVLRVRDEIRRIGTVDNGRFVCSRTPSAKRWMFVAEKELLRGTAQPRVYAIWIQVVWLDA